MEGQSSVRKQAIFEILCSSRRILRSPMPNEYPAYSNSIKLLFFDAILFIRTQTHDWKQRSQKVTTSNVSNSDILTLIIEGERVNNTRDSDQRNQQLYAH